ncbi:hypothetical protein [Micromonospora zamorensis]|uniref:hypothetical protein n=1 Tax=Micromonospora zamorensis TaxID=709883 RepID=UPI001B7293F2|nr:hypothetical protein [Micromonospora sp. M61]WTI22723.1 hypothetical protein OG886_06525 [Micromonospora zamorensis]
MQFVSSELGETAALDAAFPRRLGDDVRKALAVLPPAPHAPTSPFRVLVDGETVVIPSRIYSDAPSVAAEATLSATQRAVLDCLYTRHHDGRVRQRRLERVVGLIQPWVAPFVVQLVGEYVDEIVSVIRRVLAPELVVPHSPTEAVYGRLAAENPAFVALTGQRVASYWDCYLRRRYPTLIDYPGHVVMAALRVAAKRHEVSDGDAS